MKRLIKKAESFEFLREENLMALNEMKIKADMPVIKNILSDLTKMDFYSEKPMESKDITEKDGINILNKTISFVEHSSQDDMRVLHEIYDRVYIYAI